MLLNFKRSSGGNQSERESMGNNVFGKVAFNINLLETPFEQYTDFFQGQEDSTHESNKTTNSKSGEVSGFILSANNSDLEDIMSNNEKLDKLMQDLESIDLPLSQKRLRAKKSS
jgi:hypothetical protein